MNAEEPSKGTNGKEHSHREMQGKENSASGEHRVHRGGEHRMLSQENIWHDENETGNGGSNLDNTKCKLLNWDGTKMVVVEGTIASTDFKQLVHHVPLGPGCWKVWVKHVKVNALLFRPNHEMFVLEDAIEFEVWRFLKNFADDPRLLGEIHVALLRSIIKDIEDVARTPSSIGLGVNQNTAANPGVGHPQIVEGAKGVLNKHICNEAATLDQEDTVIDESNSGEPWVQGLMEGEYSDLSVEERLSAVVALIGIANEGNSIRIILEERLEAANALKKKMWAEVQLDKRQMKEEYVMKMQYPSYISDNAEPNVQISSVEGRQGPLPTVDDKNGLVSTNLVEQKEHLHDAQNDPNYPIHMPSERNPQIQELSTCTDNLSLLQRGYAAERSRLQLKAYIGHKVEEMLIDSEEVKPTKAGSSIGVTVADGVTDSLRKANEIISEVIYSDEDRKFDKDITIGLLCSELLNLAEYNVHMAKLLDGGRNSTWKWLAQEDLRMDTVSVLFAEWYRICELPGANVVACAHYVLQFQQSGLLKGDDLSDWFFRCLTELSVSHCLSSEVISSGPLQSPQQVQSLSFLAIDIYSKLVLSIIKVFDSKARAELLDIIFKKVASGIYF
ncbi:unnamed protein product [Camellia sinensis]